MNTVTLVLYLGVISIIIGVPLGILMAKSSKALKASSSQFSDFMQTMPGFCLFDSSSCIFRYRDGARGICLSHLCFATKPSRFIEFRDSTSTERVSRSFLISFGSTSRQKPFKLELPLAKSTIMAGINQTTMLSLSMVAIASMIETTGLRTGSIVRFTKSAKSGMDLSTGCISYL